MTRLALALLLGLASAQDLPSDMPTKFTHEMLGRLGAVIVECPAAAEADDLITICGSIGSTFDSFQMFWGLNASTAATALPQALTAWVLEDGVYRRTYQLEESLYTITFTPDTDPAVVIRFPPP